jgi:hypothetical protein
MKKRYLYSLLFGIPGFFIAGIISLVLFGTAFGVLWLFIFGDNPWPTSIESILSVVVVLIFLSLWIGSTAAGYRIGKRREADPIINKSHILISTALTVMFILFILFQQWSAGNIGPKSDATLCSDYCVRQGYSASGMPPLNSGYRTCSCYDDSGKEALKTPLDRIQSDVPK